MFWILIANYIFDSNGFLTVSKDFFEVNLA